MGIYKRKILRRKKENAFNQEKSKIEEKKERIHAFDQERKIEEKKKENTLSTKEARFLKNR